MINETRDYYGIECDRNDYGDEEFESTQFNIFDSFTIDNTIWLYDFVNAWDELRMVVNVIH